MSELVDIPVDGQVSVDGQCLPWPVLTSMLKLLVLLADISYPSLQMWTHNHLNNNNSIKNYYNDDNSFFH